MAAYEHTFNDFKINRLVKFWDFQFQNRATVKKIKRKGLHEERSCVVVQNQRTSNTVMTKSEGTQIIWNDIDDHEWLSLGSVRMKSLKWWNY